MDRKSKILLLVVICAVVASVCYTFYNTVILQNFEAVNTTENTTEEDVI